MFVVIRYLNYRTYNYINWSSKITFIKMINFQGEEGLNRRRQNKNEF